MCGRYNFSQEESDEIREIVREVERRQRGEFKMGEIYPTNVAPVLVAGDDRPVPELLAWGFPRFDKKGVVINARAETAPDKPMFRKCLEQRRCVIPSTGFYEWAADKTKYRFRLPGEGCALHGGTLQRVCRGTPLCHPDHRRERIHRRRTQPDAGGAPPRENRGVDRRPRGRDGDPPRGSANAGTDRLINQSSRKSGGFLYSSGKICPR